MYHKISSRPTTSSQQDTTYLCPLQLFVDKETVMNAVGASHDSHMLRIDNREDKLVTRINAWMMNLIKKVLLDHNFFK